MTLEQAYSIVDIHDRQQLHKLAQAEGLYTVDELAWRALELICRDRRYSEAKPSRAHQNGG